MIKQLQSERTSEASLQEILNQMAEKMGDRKAEVVELLNYEQPLKSQRVESSYQRCIWWEGCYYCQDADLTWRQVQCFR